MDAPTPDEVRHTLAPFDARHQKIVAGLLAVMMRQPQRVREREWMAEQLIEVTLFAGEFEADSPEAGVRVVQDFLHAHAEELMSASLLLFQRVALDLAPRAAAGFGFEEALRCGLEYLPSSRNAASTDEPPLARDLGEQPLANLMAACGLAPHDLVSASTEQLTHKMVARAMKGRRLTAKTMGKVRRAWIKVAPEGARESALFNYEP
jgi:hypothetical protein